MGFLTPLFLVVAGLAAPILALYMLKLRRREVEISSTYLWQMTLRDREANAPWQRLRRNLLLLVQLLLLALLTLALARPFWPVSAVARGTVIVLLDASASMQATDVAPNRFEAARQAVRDLIDSLPADSRLTLILVGDQPQVLASALTDKATLRESLAVAAPGLSAGDWPAAFALAAGAVRTTASADTSIVIVSDGGLPADLPPLPGEVRYVPIGASARNLGLEALSLRAGVSGVELFARIVNYGDDALSATLSLFIGDLLFTSQSVTVAGGQALDFSLSDLPEQFAVYTVRLSAVGSATAAPDDFPLDDVAWAVYQPPAAGRALLIAPAGNLFLQNMLAATPGLQAQRLVSFTTAIDPAFNLYVLDSVSPTVPISNAEILLVNPLNSQFINIGGVFTNTAITRVAADDPLMRYVDFSQVRVLRARQVTVPVGWRVLVEAEGGPLALAGTLNGRRMAVFTFRLQDSDLPLQLAFPILMSNLLDYLAPGQAFRAPDGLRPGETLTLKPAGGDRALAVITPNGTQYQAAVGEQEALFSATDQLGVYRVVSNQNFLGAFAVNLFSPAEAAIRPADNIRVGSAQVGQALPAAVGELELWPWLAGLALAVLAGEWWLYHRR